MDLNRLKKNILNRDWSNKSKQSNINYIKGKLKQFGLNVPKYLNQGKLTDKQIQANTNRIQREIEKQLDIKRVQANIPTMEKAMKQLEKSVKKHNQMVYKKLNYVTNKYNFSENQLNFLIGRDVSIDGYKINNKFVIRRQNSQFELIDLENFYANSIDSINSRVKQINNLNKRLTNKTIDREIANDNISLIALNNVLDTYVNEGFMETHVKNQIMEKVNSFNGLQQKAFYNMLMSSNPKSKYIINDDEFDDFQLNLYNKWNTLLSEASRF